MNTVDGAARWAPHVDLVSHSAEVGMLQAAGTAAVTAIRAAELSRSRGTDSRHVRSKKGSPSRNTRWLISRWTRSRSHHCSSRPSQRACTPGCSHSATFSVTTRQLVGSSSAIRHRVSPAPYVGRRPTPSPSRA